MPIKTTHAILCLPLLLSSHIAIAQEGFDNIRVVTGLSLGYSDFSFPEKLDHNISFPSATIPIALTMNNWQLSLNASSTLADAEIAEEEDIGKASRKDLDLTLGYRVTKNWSLFAGFKYGKTEMSFVPRDFDEEIDEDEGIRGEDEAGSEELTDESYSQKGPFIGASYSWQFEKAGSLNISLAYAFLDATNNFSANTDDEEEEEELTEFDDLSGQVKGDTKGFSYGLSWTMPLSSSLLFQTRFKINAYQQDIVVDGERFENIDETFTTLHVGLAYVF
jgi:hypothetical protein